MKSLVHLGIALAVLLSGVALCGLSYYALSQAQTKAALLSKQVAAKTADAARVAQARAALSTLTSDEAALRAYFVAKEDIVPFLEGLQATGRALGAKVAIISVTDIPKNRVALSLTAAGSFDAVMRTIGAIEYGPHDGVITQMNLEVSGTGPEKIWTANATYSVGLASTTAYSVGVASSTPYSAAAAPTTTYSAGAASSTASSVGVSSTTPHTP
jgi:hypothetical protein